MFVECRSLKEFNEFWKNNRNINIYNVTATEKPFTYDELIVTISFDYEKEEE